MKILTLLAAIAIGTSVASAQSRITVSGYITDGKSAETIIGATVYDAQSGHGTASNNFGFYSLTLAAGQHQLTFSYVGYNRQTISLNLRRDTAINISLSSDIEIEEVVVTAKSRESGIESTKMGSIDIPVKLIEHTPSLLGETDVLRTIQLTPGVQQGVGGASTLYVRGGNGDENLILLDGATVYKIDHLFGFFSVFTPEAVKKVTFYKSSFPARYNGRTSSVIDVRTKDGDMNNYHASVSVGLLTSRFNVEGPIKEGKTSFNISGRTTYAGALAQPFLDDDLKINYWFYDINLKLNHKFSDADRLYLSLYNGLDKFIDKIHDVYETSDYKDIDDYGADLRWRNFIPSLRWNHVFSSKLFANATVNYNHYKMRMGSYDDMTYIHHRNDPEIPERYSNEKSSSDYRSEIKDFGAILDFDWMPLPAHTVKFGANYTRHNFEPETTTSSYKEKEDSVTHADTSATNKGSAAFANEISVYVDDDWKIADNLNLNIGLAHTVFNLKNRTYHNLQPRLSLKYDPVDFLTIKASYSRMTQCVHLLTSSPLAMPTDLWVPITEELEPEVANQYSLGAYTKIDGWEFSVEGYYKLSDNVLEYKDGMSFAGFSGSWEKLVAAGQGESKGLEFMAQKTEGVITGLVSYTLSKTDRKFSRSSGVNDGERFPFTYDRRHNLNVVMNWQVNDRIFVDLSWSFQSGACATLTDTYQEYVDPDNQFQEGYSSNDPSTIVYHKKDGKIAYIPGRNNYRLPCSHTLCAGVDFHKQKKHCERIFNISVYNLYNHMNPTMVYATEADDYGSYGGPRRYRIKKLTILPIIPSFTLTYKF